MTRAELTALLPFFALGATAVAALVAIGVRRSHGLVAGLTWVGLLAAAGALIPAAAVAPRVVTPLVVVDGLALLFTGLLIVVAGAVSVLARADLERRGADRPEELYVLLVIAALGGAMLAASRHIASLFVALETLSVALYALIAYPRFERAAAEAGLKYLVLAGATSAFTLFGLGLLYAELGTMSFPALAGAVAQASDRPLVMGAGALVLVGIAFKLALVPFHAWVSDVYGGAPAPVAGFLAAASKSAVLALLNRLSGVLDGSSFGLLLAGLAGASMLVGNLMALRARRVKHLLAYSSIAHVGYAVTAAVAGGRAGTMALAFYAVAYSASTLCAFGVVAVLARSDGERAEMDAYRGLAWTHPFSAAVLVVALLSLTGIPLTAGFMAKLNVLAASTAGARWVLIALLVVGSVVGAFYYLRWVAVIFAPAPDHSPAPRAVPLAAGVAVALLAAAILALGVAPSPVQDLVRRAERASLLGAGPDAFVTTPLPPKPKGDEPCTLLERSHCSPASSPASASPAAATTPPWWMSSSTERCCPR